MANRDMILAQDNVLWDIAKTKKEFFEANIIRVLPWPAYFPNLDTIEYIYDFVKWNVGAIPRLRYIDKLKIYVYFICGRI